MSSPGACPRLDRGWPGDPVSRAASRAAWVRDAWVRDARRCRAPHHEGL